MFDVMLQELAFPDPRFADSYGLVAIGGDYRPQRLLVAYANGIFPWPSEEFPHAWFSPDPRLVLLPEEIYLSRSLKKTLRRGTFDVTYDLAFEEVLHACAETRRPDTDGTWLTPELRHGLTALHKAGFAHSVESWSKGELVGGLYGLALGACFIGESMFFKKSDASKVAFASLAERLRRWKFRMIDCQVHTPHLERFGAREWPRRRFLDELERCLRVPTRRGPWTETEPPDDEDPGARSPG